MKAIRSDILNSIDSYNSIINQRESEVKSIYNDIKVQEFYNKKEALEKHFNVFTQYKTNLKGFIKYYKQNIKQYKKDFNTYAEFIVKLKEDINKIKQNKPLCENLEITNKIEALETKAHINSVKTGVNDNIKDLIIKPVPNCPGYSYGKYGIFDVIFRDSDGFINATKLCKLGGKDYSDWNRPNLEGPKQLIESLKLKLFEKYKSNIGMSMSNMIFLKFEEYRNSSTNTQNITSFEDVIVEDDLGKYNTPKIIYGTYVHPKLIPAIASWISPVFALKVADIVEEYFVKKANEKLSSLIREKDNKIDTLIKKVDKQNKKLKHIKHINLDQTNKIDELKQINLKQDNILKEQTDKINQLLSYGKEARNALVNIDSNIEEIHSKSIEPCKASIETELVLLYNNTGNDHNVVKVKNENGLISVLYPFTFIRRQRKSINNTVKKHIPFKASALKKLYPKAEVVFKRTIINAVTALNNIKQDLIKSKNNKKITFVNNHIILNIGYSKESFLEDIDNITSKYIPPLTRVENETGKFI